MNQDSQSWLAAIVNSSDDAIIGKTLAGIITSWNPGAEKIFGYGAAEAIGQPIRLLFPPDRADEEKELLARIGRGERIDHFETVRVCKDGRHIYVSATLSPVTDAGGKIIGASKIARDITRHKLQAQEISRMSRLYSALSQVNQSIVRSRSREELFANICRVMIEFGRFELAWVGQLNPETKEVNVVAQHGAASAVGYVKNIRVYANDRPEGSGPAGVSIRDGRAYVCNDFGNDPAMAPWHELAVRHGLAACVSVPILLAGKVCGALLVYAAEKDFFGDKEVALMVEAAVDISFALDHFAMEQQRREAEAALRENEARFRAIFNHHALGTAIIESDATISMVNDAYCRVSGYTREEVIGKSWHRTVMPEDLERLAEYSRRRQANPEAAPAEYEFRYRHKCGQPRDAQMAVAQIPSSGQSIVSMLDITERKRQEQQLTRLMESFVGLGIDPEENIKRLVAVCGELGQATCALYNRRQDEYLCALGWHTPPDLPSRDLAEGHICADIIRQNTGIPVVIRDLQVGGYAQTDPNVLRYGLKTYIGVVVRCQKQAVGSLCLVYQTDVPPDAEILKVIQILAAAVGNEEERKQAQEQFKLLTSALTAVANAIVITDRHAKIEWVNPAFTRVTGYEADEVIGKDPRLLKSGQHSRAFYADLWDTVLAGNVWRGEVVNKRKDGSLFTEDTTITPVRGADGQIAHFVAIRQDVTERRQLETRMQQAQKMEAIGALAGGIAHDFNNILGAMIGFGSLLQEDTAGNTAAQESVTEILKAADRARELVRQILTFSRQRERKRDVIRLDAVIKEAAKFLRASLPSSIQIQLHLAPDAPTVMADSTQIYQVTMNLATNALHAMEGQSGLLTIGLEAFQADEHFIKMHPGLKPIQYARLTVADTGHGMDAKTLERIFEPFFTTKPVGKGTGLGLSVVHGIVQSHEGAITVYSEVGRGTTFHLYFPAQAQAETLSENAGNPAVKGRGQKILLLDDEPALTTALERQLVRLNYRVTSSNRAREVIDLFRENPARFDLVISDLTMPEMNGLEVARELHVLRPDLPIILVSGFVADLKLETLKEAGVSEVIDKPISVTALADLLRQTFAPPGAATS